MKNQTDYEAIGRLARDYYVAEVERINARNARNRERASHPCLFETESNEAPCWAYATSFTSLEARQRSEWCDNCKHVQPYYLTYRLAAKKASAVRYGMTRRIQAKMLSEAEE